MLSLSSIFILACIAVAVSSHGTINKFSIAGKSFTGFLDATWFMPADQRPPTYGRLYGGSNAPCGSGAGDLTGFVADPTCAELACHQPSPMPAQLYAPANAGDAITFYWSKWPSHPGFMMTYMASCNGNCSKFDGKSVGYSHLCSLQGWFKIDEAGYDASKKQWATLKMQDSLSWTSKIPSGLKSGNYLIRHEAIALHGSTQVNGAQYYPSCFQLTIKGGSRSPPSTVSFPGGYKSTDSGLYNPDFWTMDYTNFPIPGPAKWA